MVAHFLPGNPCVTAWVKAHYELITADFFMFSERSIVDLLWTAISVINAFQFEEIFELVLERDGYFEELDTSTAQGTLKLIHVDLSMSRVAISLPPFYASSTENIAALGTFLGISQQVLANLADKIGNQVLIPSKLHALKQSFSRLCLYIRYN